MCHSSRLRAERWAVRAGQPFDADVLAGADGRAKGYAEEMVLEADGRVYKAAEAWLKVLSLAPWYLRWLRILGKTRLTMALARIGYGVVAKYRRRWFGTRACRLS